MESAGDSLEIRMELFCSLCLRSKPPDVEFYKQIAENSVEFQVAFRSILGYDILLENFVICMPCWKIIQLIRDFRLRCEKANSLLKGIGRGLSREDCWFSERTLTIIEDVRTVVKDQLVQIEREGDRRLASEDVLESTLDIGEVKIELGEEVPEQTESKESIVKIKEEPVAGNENKGDDETNQAEPISIPPLDHEYSAEQVLESILDIGEAKIEGEEEDFENVTDQPPVRKIEIESNTESDSDLYDISAISSKFDVSGLMQCSKCSRLFQSSEHKLHEPNCDGKSPFRIHKCPQCPMTFIDAHKLVDHVNRHSDETPFQCRRECNRGFPTADIRNRHELRCVQDVKQCVFCKKWLHNRFRLYEHYRLVHQQERKFPCSQCDKWFSRKDHLKRHEERLHSGERLRQFACELCDKAFFEEDHLKNHMNVHSEEAPFKCEVDGCGRHLRSKFALELHNAAKHPELASESALKLKAREQQRYRESSDRRKQERLKDPLQITVHDCEICGKRLRSKFSLDLHMAGKHPEQASEKALKVFARTRERYRAISSRRKEEKGALKKAGRKSKKRKHESSSESDTEISEDYSKESDTE